MKITKRTKRGNKIVDYDPNATKKKTSRGSSATLISRKENDYSYEFMSFLQKAENSKQLADVFKGEYGTGKFDPIEPPYDYKGLIRIFAESTTLRQCIEAYVVNIESYGYTFDYVGPEGDQDSEAALSELTNLYEVLQQMTRDKDLAEIRGNSRWDKEVLGNRCFEIARDEGGRITLLSHVQSATIRLTRQDPEPVDIVLEYPNPADPEKTIRVETQRKFRRFVQIAPNGKKVYFKEFGDPRRVDPATGKVDENMSVEDSATEIYYDSMYVPGHVYGLPRYIGQIPAILGSKEAEYVNLNFFRDNAIPAMVIMVAGGALTQEAFDNIENQLLAIQGQKAMQRLLIVEATSDDVGDINRPSPAPKIDLKPMISERQQDGLFQDYDAANQVKVRNAFRLPPIYLGRADDYTRASAQASMLTAENQIFMPERYGFDMFMNKKILSTYKPKYWRYKSLGAPIVDAESMARMIKSIGAEGALTPNTVIKIANKVLDVNIEFIDDDWGDIPFALVMAMIRNGDRIKGLTDFIEEMNDQLDSADKPDDNADGNTGDSADGASDETVTNMQLKLRRSLKSELRKFSHDVTDALKEGLQTVATEE